jgi:hypothetical protein
MVHILSSSPIDDQSIPSILQAHPADERLNTSNQIPHKFRIS